MTLKGARILLFVEEEYEDMELWYPKLRLTEAGAEVVVAGLGKETYHGKKGYPVKVDGSVKDYRPDDFDGVVIPGGHAPDKLRASREVLEFVRKTDEAGKLVAAICHAGWVLASAGIVKRRTVTCYHTIRDDVVNAGAEYVDQTVVVDRNLVTSRFPADLPNFCREMIRVLEEQGAQGKRRAAS
ncbi:MAG: type 1 glutamine amidotransferase [Acidobacteria bacterium]|nr:type 1 glutamine amidotransferase [Acidobacteriota bacterium]